jgi:hypothetical protein
MDEIISYPNNRDQNAFLYKIYPQEPKIPFTNLFKVSMEWNSKYVSLNFKFRKYFRIVLIY